MATPIPRRVVGALSTLLLAIVTVAGFAGPAHAEDGYKYWNYFHLQDKTWAFSDVGPADYKPEDGAVEGFRYGTSTVAKGLEPRADLAKVDFDTVCADAEKAEGKKRVAVLLDYGTEEGAGTPPEPRADCAVVAADASSQQVLGAVAEVRLDSGMTCAVDGYPAAGCGEPVKNAQVPNNEETVAFALPSDSGDDAVTSRAAVESQAFEVPWGLVGLGALVVLIAGTAVVVTRRRRNA